MTFLLRFGALCGALSGLFIALPGAVEGFVGETTATSLVIGVSPALAAPLLTALYLKQPRTTLGTVGYVVNFLGLGLFGAAAYALNIVLFHLDQPILAAPTKIVLTASALIFAVGTVLFAMSMIKARTHPLVPVWTYAIALPLFTFAAPLPDTPLTSALHVVVGGTLVWLARSVYPAAIRPAANSSPKINTMPA
ncbi:hypothetical protein ALI22I_44835 [Saccharothrix sp. ALI-22-I]|uniref:hypothetical protein n=1 Tax=Saccharothrix sp. ALI-22-I TaxID=1933778 RepID=UPI00097C53C9|nr:hypothetical protein [Saccharothrix sp. ALI-22-I]ONI80440.1 hypothetical protein ALI22I_44835 [Saccharothrix sp. ALI-22-I]